MKVRAKTTTRLTILIVAMFVVVAGVGGAYVFRKRQIHNRHLGYRQIGMEAYKRGDYETAHRELARYIKPSQYAGDHEAIYALAESARQNEQSDLTHLVVTAGLYKRFLELQPQREDVRRELLRLNRQLNQFPEALSVADQILAANRNDPEALYTKALALANLKRVTEAVPLARAAVAEGTGNPRDIDAQVLLLQLYLDSRNKAEADKDPVNKDVAEPRKVPAGQTVLKRALKLYADNPGDGRFELLLSRAYLICGDLTPEHREHLKTVLAAAPTTRPATGPVEPQAAVNIDARAAAVYYARQACKRPIPSVEHLRMLVSQLEHLSLPAETLDVVLRAEQSVSDRAVRKYLIRRLFETERYTELDQRLARMTLSAKRPDDVEALGMKGITLIRLQRQSELPAVIAELSTRPQDKVAAAWATILGHFIDPKDPLVVADACREAIKLDRSNPYLRFFLATACEDLGERALAIENYRAASTLSRLWALPPRRLARLLSASGEADQAVMLSEHSFLLLNTQSGYIEHLIYLSDALGPEKAVADDALFARIKHVQQELPGEEQTLPLYVLMLHKRNHGAAVRKVLADVLAARPPRSEALLLRLASLLNELKVTDPGPVAFIDAAQKHHGVTPASAFARGVEIFRRGKPDDALASFELAFGAAPRNKELEWRHHRAQFLEVLRDPRAAEAWITLADDPRTKADVRIQRAALVPASVQHDTDFLRRTAQRLRAATGEQGIAWKIAQAKVLLADRARPNVQEAIRLLREVTLASPLDAEARILLAMALERSGDQRGAIDQALAAVKRRPDAPQVRLLLASLYTAESDFLHAREQILAIPVERMEPEHIGQAARLLHQQGDTANALALLEKLPDALLDGSSGALRADLYRRRNQPALAEAIYRQLIDKRDLRGPRDALITGYADFLAESGKTQEARAVLARLDTLQLPPGRKQLLLAEYFIRQGDENQAMEHYRAAVKEAPGTELAWRALIGRSLRDARTADGVAEASEALKTLPEAQHFAAIVKNAELLKAASAEARLIPLVMSILQQPSDAQAIVDALQVCVDAAKNREAPVDTLGKLKTIADRAPRITALRAMLVEGYTAIGRRDEAMKLAVTAAELFPNSIDLVRMSAEALGHAGEHRKALEAARRWRELTPANPLPADVFSARVHIAMGSPDLALAQIDPYLKSPPADDNALRDLVSVHSLLLAAQKKHDDVTAVLRPHLNRGPAWRQLWLERAMLLLSDPKAVAARLEEIEQSIPPANHEERAVLAASWYQLSAAHRHDKNYRDRAAQMLDAMLPQSGSWMAYFTRALIDDAEGEYAAAEKGYRKSLELNPSQPVAQNNLAMLILRRKGDANEAKALAARAVEARPNFATFYDTYAQALTALMDHRGAVAQLKTAVKLEPNNVEWKIRLALALGANRDLIEAGSVLNDVDALLPDKSKLPEDLRKQLQQLRERLNGRTADVRP